MCNFTAVIPPRTPRGRHTPDRRFQKNREEPDAGSTGVQLHTVSLLVVVVFKKYYLTFLGLCGLSYHFKDLFRFHAFSYDDIDQNL